MIKQDLINESNPRGYFVFSTNRSSHFPMFKEKRNEENEREETGCA